MLSKLIIPVIDTENSTFETDVKMTKEQFDNLMYVRDTLETLKNKIRQGVINWNITGIRRESIAEHVYSTQQLAWLMWLATNKKIDIFKVVKTTEGTLLM